MVNYSCAMEPLLTLFKVLFGDPFDGRPIENIPESIVDTFCFSFDLICEDTIVVDLFHLLYSVDAAPAANFVAGLISV
jgi:cutinase